MARQSIYDFWDLQQKPRMTTDELEEMLILIIRSPDVCELARNWLRDADWDMDNERHFWHVMNLFAQLNAQQLPVDKTYYRNVRDELKSRMNADPRLKDSPKLIAAILGRPTDPEQIEGLLYRAYQRAVATRADVRRAVAIAKKFLIERQVDAEILKIVHEATEWENNKENSNGMIDPYHAAKLAQLEKLRAGIEARRPRLTVTLKDLDPECDAWHEVGLDREFIGLKTGLASLDRRLDGLQGVFIVVAAPGRGKTVLGSQLGCGVADDFEINDAAVVVISLEMRTITLLGRIRSHLARMDWSVLRHGSQELRHERGDQPLGQPRDKYYNREDNAKLDAVRAKLAGDFGDRISVYGKDDLPGVLDADALVSLLAEAKAKVKATRGLLVIDFLQLMKPPEAIEKRGEVDCDNWRIQVLKDVVARTTTGDNPEGDCIAVISEASKPPDSKTEWATTLRDIKGSGRTASLADACLHIRPMSGPEVKNAYGLVNASKELVAEQLEKLDKAGVWPAMFVLTKSRDGTRRKPWAMEFLYRQSTWRRPPKPPVTQRKQTVAADRAVDQNGDGKIEAARERILAVLAAAPGGETEAVLAREASIGKGRIKAILKKLIDDGLVEEVTTFRPHGNGMREQKVYRLIAANVQPADSHANNGSTAK